MVIDARQTLVPLAGVSSVHYYSLLAADYGISIAGVYRPDKGLLAEVPGAGGVSALNAVGGLRGQEALYASSWFRTITAETFG